MRGCGARMRAPQAVHKGAPGLRPIWCRGGRVPVGVRGLRTRQLAGPRRATLNCKSADYIDGLEHNDDHGSKRMYTRLLAEAPRETADGTKARLVEASGGRLEDELRCSYGPNDIGAFLPIFQPGSARRQNISDAARLSSR